MYGSILNYDNITVATKAFNRLLAVADWAVAREKEQRHQAEEPVTRSSVGRQLKETLGAIREQAEADRANKQWKRAEYRPGSEEFTGHPLYKQTHELLTCWKRHNYGSLSGLMTHDLHNKYGKSVRSEIRLAFEPFPLDDFEICAVRHDMEATGTVLAVLAHSGGKRVSAELRWGRENAPARPCPEPMPGQWRLVFQPRVFLDRANSLPAE
ncbi:hypothetical protein [Streptomyces californicus]|uniref:hypothetical protein n=1 Tax=Streptomyces californicus TaxID=67351 RepID=UPI0033FBD6E4